MISQDKGDQIDANKLFKSFGLDIISHVVFSLQINNFKDDQLRTKIGDIFKISKLDHLILFLIPKKIAQLFKVSALKKSIADYFVKMALSIIAARKQHPNIVYNDFLEMLLKGNSESNKMTTQEIVGNCFLFFAAGMETTSIFFITLFFELAIDQDVQEKLYREIINYHPNEVPFENLNDSHYLDCVVNEYARPMIFDLN